MSAKLLPARALLARAIAIALVIVMAPALAACLAEPEAAPATATPPAPIAYSERVDGYLASGPATLRAGRTEHISVSLFDGAEPARGAAQVSLLQGIRTVAEAEATVSGAAAIPLAVPPELSSGSYTLRIAGGAGDTAFADSGRIRVEPPPALLFLETDKPIYRPGQQIRIRALRLDDNLKPMPGPVTIEIQDAKGIKVYRQIRDADEFGIVNASLPLSTEPNLGVWKATAKSGEQSAQVDVRVERYVLPKYEVRVDLPQEWTLVGDPVAGSVSAEYAFGKPVRGEVAIVASRYVGVWEEYARFEGPIDGTASFELLPAGYVAGVPGAAGQGHLQLDITVREPATGYEERITRLLPVSETPMNLQLIPESRVFKPGLPFGILVAAETPDNRPVVTEASLELTYVDQEFETIAQESRSVTTGEGGGALLEATPPADAVGVTITASAPDASASLALEAGYSPSGSFIHIAPAGDTAQFVGDRAAFRVHSTAGGTGRFYYEVIGRGGGIVFSDVAWTPDIAFELTPAMTPTARLVVYQIMPDGEVAADYIPFRATPSYPMPVAVAFSDDEVRPGAAVDISVTTPGPARVGLAAVDRSVFILAENRLNLQQVFDELERQYRQPRAEIHYHSHLPAQVAAPGAADIFQDAGLMTLSNRAVPAGVAFQQQQPGGSYWPGTGLVVTLVVIGLVALAFVVGIAVLLIMGVVKVFRHLLTALAVVLAVALAAGLVACGGQAGYVAAPEDYSAGGPNQPESAADGLAAVERVRQFFPETWLWADVTTDASGRATLPATAPDSITTWQLRAVGVSPEYGLGIADTALRVFQPFFLQVDLPYSVIRGEEFPVRVALYNYLDTPQEFVVELAESPAFALLDEQTQRVTVPPNDVGSAEFNIRPTELGRTPLRVTARSPQAADAVVKHLLVAAEGVARESVANAILSPGDHPEGERIDFDIAPPADAVAGSARAYVALTGSYLAQSIEGLEDLLQMPYGCGEQNMVLFAPNVFVVRYLDASDQLQPAIMAQAERFMTTGYQRQLTYRREDGSFSAFGESDASGSLWLTAFVLKSFAQADGLIYADEAVLRDAASWLLAHRRNDGSFKPVGFVHHQELLGGLRGNTALTAYVAIALHEAGYRRETGVSVAYLERALDDISDPYTMAMVAYALQLAGSPRADEALAALLEMAVVADDEMHWGRDGAAVETTGYAILALVAGDDPISAAPAASAARWLATQRNAFGGYGSTQDTVVGLQAMAEYAATAGLAADLTVTLTAGDWQRQATINAENSDLVQIVELPAGASSVSIAAAGSGQAVAQVVRRFNLPTVSPPEVELFRLDVAYGADNVAVDDTIEIAARLVFAPPPELSDAGPDAGPDTTPDAGLDAGMVVLDVAVPTGFAPVLDTLERLTAEHPQVKRHEIAGRKVIIYLENVRPGAPLELRFAARAQYPARARPVTSQAYSYYTPHWRGETLGQDITVSAR